MKKVYLFLYVIILLVLSSSVFATYGDYWGSYKYRSSDRTEYYTSGAYNMTDDIGDGIGMNGNVISVGETPVDSAWPSVTAACTYVANNGYLGNSTYMINCKPGSGFEYNIVDNASFVGQVGATVTFVGDPPNNGTEGFYMVMFGTGGDGHMFINTRNDEGGNEWCYGANNVCDENTILFGAGTTYTLLFNYTNTTAMDSYIAVNDSDLVLCHKWVVGTLTQWRFSTATAEPEVNITDIFMSPHARPLGAAPAAGPSGTPADPTWKIPTADTWNNNTNITMNITHATDVNYFVYLDDAVYLSNVSQTGNYYLSFLTDLPDGSYTFAVTAWNTTSGLFSSNVTRTWILDTASPTITLGSNNGFLTDNSTKINSYSSNLTINISFFDTYLEGGQALINITNSTNENMTTILNISITGTTANYSKTIDIGDWAFGNYTVILTAADSHTLNSIEDYYVKTGHTYLEYTTTEGTKIKIETLESALSISSFATQKLKDRYEFEFNFADKKKTTTFRVTSSNKLNYIKDSTYNAHFTTFNGIRGNWIDFDSIGLTGENYDVKKVNDYVYDVIIKDIYTDNLLFKSIGGLNIVEEHYRLEVNSLVHVWAFDAATNTTLPNYDVTINSIMKSGTATVPASFNLTSGDFTASVSSTDFLTTELNISITDTFHNFSVNMSATNAIDDCSVFSDILISFHGKDEETNLNVTMDLDITIEHFFEDNVSDKRNSSFELNGSIKYDICTNIEGTFVIDSIMEYGDGVIYTDRKYYINNLSINTTNPETIFLYHLNNSKASEITFTVFDQTTGDRISGAFIKVLRFYPGENVYRIVEIDKTDELGETLGKMVLADVFYKFIIEKPAGEVKLDTGVLRILSLTRNFGISFVEDVLATWDKIHGVSTSVTCTKGTKTCRITWSDSSNIVQDATLEVWRSTGVTNTLLSTQTTAAAAGTISYTIIETTDGNAYSAKGFIESNTGTSLYGVGVASLLFSDNPFFTNETHRIASLFPLFLLVVCIVFSLVDFGTIGVVIGSLLGMIAGSIIGILPIDPFYLISFILMAILLIYKLSK